MSAVRMVISSEQCRAARAWLGWQQADLARKAAVSISTVRDFETGRRTPMTNNARAIASAIEEAGLSLLFLADGIPSGIELSSGGRRVGKQAKPREELPTTSQKG